MGGVPHIVYYMYHRYRELYERSKSLDDQTRRKIIEKISQLMVRRQIPLNIGLFIMRFLINPPHPLRVSPRELRLISNFMRHPSVRDLLPGEFVNGFDRIYEASRYLVEEFPEVPELREETPELKIPSSRYIISMITQTHERVHELYLLSRKVYEVVTGVSKTVDIILKGQCPFCGGDLVEVIVNNELRLRCKRGTYDECKKWDWVIGTIRKVRRP